MVDLGFGGAFCEELVSGLSRSRSRAFKQISFSFLSKLVAWKIVRRVRCRIWRWRKEIREERTGASTQSRNAFSRPWHPPAAPPAAQQSVIRNRLSVKGEPVQRKPKEAGRPRTQHRSHRSHTWVGFLLIWTFYSQVGD